jgi:O-antigen/teichoic acid export membrane protein
MSRRPIRINFTVNLLSAMMRIAVALVTIPIYLRLVGEARYGVISIVWVLLGLFGFLDLGLSRTVTNALAKLRDAPQAHRARVLLTTFGLNLGIGLIGGVVLYVLGGFLLRYFISVPDALSSEVSRSLPWIACLLPLTLISAAGAGALESRELFLLVNSIQVVAMTLAQVAPVVAAVFVSPSLIPAAALAQASGAIAILAVVYHLEALSRPRLRRSIYHWVGDGGRVGRSLRGADEPCPKEQCHPGGIRAHPLSPHVEPVQRCSLCTGNARALSTMAYGFAAICAPAIILAPTFFRYWIGADFAMISAPVAQMLFPGMWMGSLALVGFTLLQSQGRADVTGRLSIIEFLPFIAILWSLTWAFGIVGGAAAWSFRCAVDALATLWLAGMKRRDVLPLLPPAALLAASLVVARFLGSSVLENFLVAAFAASASVALGCLFSEDWRTLILAQLNRTRVFFGTLTNRAKPSPPVNTNPQK